MLAETLHWPGGSPHWAGGGPRKAGLTSGGPQVHGRFGLSLGCWQPSLGQMDLPCPSLSTGPEGLCAHASNA